MGLQLLLYHHVEENKTHGDCIGDETDNNRIGIGTKSIAKDQ